MDIDLTDAVVVIDEAHNIEDVSRSAASRDLDYEDIQQAYSELETMVESQQSPDLIRPFFQILKAMLSWLDLKIPQLSAPGSRESIVWSGEEAVEMLSELGLSAQNIEALRKALSSVTASDESSAAAVIVGRASLVLEGLITVCEMLFANNAPHYRMVLLKSSEWRAGPRGRGGSKVTVFKLCFWCLHPGVAFSRVTAKTHSVILTSGTLAPIESFASELGTLFDVRLEANHVIDKSQVLVACVSHATNGMNVISVVLTRLKGSD